MLTYILLRIRRTPLPALAVLLFAAVLAAVLCGLHASNEAELAHFQEVYQTLPVKLTVTNLKGTKSDGLGIDSDFAQSFTGVTDQWLPDDLADYVKDVQRKTSRGISQIGDAWGEFRIMGSSSVDLCRELWPENGAMIRWADGYDASCLAGTERVCLIPSDLDSDMDGKTDSGTIQIYFAEDKPYEFTIVGTVMGGGENTLYCPFLAMEHILLEADEYGYYSLDAMCATLKDNDLLEEFREAMLRWYIEPDPSGLKTKWEDGWYEYYQYALDINDAQLQAASETLESSLTVNQISTLLVFVLSAGAGFFVGFLMIRQRKREISLMRTLGEANGRVYCSFALEQMVCVILGTAAGGAYFAWQPVGRLLLFALIYFVGLSAALLVFLRKNLLSTMKEDE